MNHMKITVKYLKSYQTFGVFRGNKAVGPSDFATDKTAVTWAQKRFPNTTVAIKNFYK
jgi:hypothetical protein